MTHFNFMVEKKSKYQEKVKKRWYETESGTIAYQIEQVELQFYRNKDMYKSDLILLEDGYSICRDSFCSAWIVYKSDEMGESWQKVVPMAGLSKDILFNILQAQPWVCT